MQDLWHGKFYCFNFLVLFLPFFCRDMSARCIFGHFSIFSHYSKVSLFLGYGTKIGLDEGDATAPTKNA